MSFKISYYYNCITTYTQRSARWMKQKIDKKNGSKFIGWKSSVQIQHPLLCCCRNFLIMCNCWQYFCLLFSSSSLLKALCYPARIQLCSTSFTQCNTRRHHHRHHQRHSSTIPYVHEYHFFFAFFLGSMK